MYTCVLVAILSVAAQPAPTQSWSHGQQDVIDVILRCNNAWVQSIAEKDYLAFDRACAQTRDAAFWYPRAETPVTHHELWKNSSKNLKRVSFEVFKPVLVLVNKDVAVIYYFVTWIPELVAGEVPRNRSKRVTALQRENGMWYLAGGSISLAD